MSTAVAPQTPPHPSPPIKAPYCWPAGWPLLAAEWRDLVMLNYEVDPAILAPLVPAGTELDFDRGKTFLSIVGFEFRRTRFMGMAVPFHTRFPEVNLRFYIRRRAADGWRRGVAFVRELAPRRAVAIIANCFYGERYLTVQMRRQIKWGEGELADQENAPRRVEYGWRHNGREGARGRRDRRRRGAAPCGGFARGVHHRALLGLLVPRAGRAKEYAVAHPPWRIRAASAAQLDCDARALYGAALAEFLCGPPASAFWVDGSSVRVYCGRRIQPEPPLPSP